MSSTFAFATGTTGITGAAVANHMGRFTHVAGDMGEVTRKSKRA